MSAMVTVTPGGSYVATGPNTIFVISGAIGITPTTTISGATYSNISIQIVNGASYGTIDLGTQWTNVFGIDSILVTGTNPYTLNDISASVLSHAAFGSAGTRIPQFPTLNVGDSDSGTVTVDASTLAGTTLGVGMSIQSAGAGAAAFSAGTGGGFFNLFSDNLGSYSLNGSAASSQTPLSVGVTAVSAGVVHISAGANVSGIGSIVDNLATAHQLILDPGFFTSNGMSLGSNGVIPSGQALTVMLGNSGTAAALVDASALGTGDNVTVIAQSGSHHTVLGGAGGLTLQANTPGTLAGDSVSGGTGPVQLTLGSFGQTASTAFDLGAAAALGPVTGLLLAQPVSAVTASAGLFGQLTSINAIAPATLVVGGSSVTAPTNAAYGGPLLIGLTTPGATFALPVTATIGFGGTVSGGTGTRVRLTGSTSSGVNLTALAVPIVDVTGGAAFLTDTVGGAAQPAFVINNSATNSQITMLKAGATAFGGSGSDSIRGLGSGETLVGSYAGGRLDAWGNNQTVFAADTLFGSSPVCRPINVAGQGDIVVGRYTSGGGTDTVNLAGGGADTVFAGAGAMTVRNNADANVTMVGGAGLLQARSSARGGDVAFGGAGGAFAYFNNTRDSTGASNSYVGGAGSGVVYTSSYVGTQVFTGTGAVDVVINPANTAGLVDTIVGFRSGTDSIDLSQFGLSLASVAGLAQTSYQNGVDVALPTGITLRLIGPTKLSTSDVILNSVTTFTGTSGIDSFSGPSGATADTIYNFSATNLSGSDTVAGPAVRDDNTLAITDSGPVTLTASQFAAVSNIDQVVFRATTAGSAVSVNSSLASLLSQADWVFSADATISAPLSSGNSMVVRPNRTLGHAVTLTLSSATSNSITAFDNGRPVPGTALNIVGGGLGDAIFGSRNAVNVTGGAGNDSIASFLANDTIKAGAGADTIFTGGGNDLLIYGAVTDSYSSPAAWDVVQGFKPGRDKIDFQPGLGSSLGLGGNLAGGITVTSLVVTNGVSSLAQFAAGINSAGTIAASTTSQLQLALVTVNGGTFGGQYLIVNDGTAGYQSNADMVINLAGARSQLTPADFIIA